MLKFLKKLLRKVTLDYTAKKVQKEIAKNEKTDGDIEDLARGALLKLSKEALEQYNENRRGKD